MNSRKYSFPKNQKITKALRHVVNAPRADLESELDELYDREKSGLAISASPSTSSSMSETISCALLEFRVCQLLFL